MFRKDGISDQNIGANPKIYLKDKVKISSKPEKCQETYLTEQDLHYHNATSNSKFLENWNSRECKTFWYFFSD